MSHPGPHLSAEPFELTMARGRTACIRLGCADGATAVVSLHGAQVLSWITTDGREQLFLSRNTDLAPGAAIRGGIPVIFPQFAARGPLTKHGFARISTWDFEGVDDVSAVFRLRDDMATRAQWPHAFDARLLVAPTASSLTVALEIANTGDAPFAFTCALHAYLRVDALDRAALHGLAGAAYIDSVAGGTTAREAEAPLRFDNEVDRIHVGGARDTVLQDGDRALRIAMQGFSDTVTWNPGAALAATMPDLEPGGFRQFVCVEPACIVQPVQLAPSGRWRGVLELAVVGRTAAPRGDA